MLSKKPKFSKAMLRSKFAMERAGIRPVATERASAWRVRSQTRERVVYTVTVSDEKARLITGCTCKAGAVGGGCKHQLMVLSEFDRDNRHWIKLLDEQQERAEAA